MRIDASCIDWGVVVRAGVALSLTAVMSYCIVTNTPLPDTFTAAYSAIIGFFFATGRTTNGGGKQN